MKFRQIRYANNKVHLAWEETKGNDTLTGELDSTDVPLQTLEESLQALAPFVCNVLELDGEYTTGMVVTKVSLKGDEFMIIAKKEVEGSNSPFNIITPKLDRGAETTDGDLIRAIDKVIAEARRFKKGERNQIELPLGEKKED